MRRFRQVGYLIPALGTAIAVIAVLSAVALKVMDSKLSTSREETRVAREDLAAERQSRAGFEEASKSCTASVEALRRSADEARAAYDIRLATSRRETESVQGYVTELLSRGSPEGLDECRAVIKELDDEIDRRHPRS